MNHHVGARNQTWVRCNRNKSSSLLSHRCSPASCIFSRFRFRHLKGVSTVYSIVVFLSPIPIAWLVLDCLALLGLCGEVCAVLTPGHLFSWKRQLENACLCGTLRLVQLGISIYVDFCSYSLPPAYFPSLVNLLCLYVEIFVPLLIVCRSLVRLYPSL